MRVQDLTSKALSFSFAPVLATPFTSLFDQSYSRLLLSFYGFFSFYAFTLWLHVLCVRTTKTARSA